MKSMMWLSTVAGPDAFHSNSSKVSKVQKLSQLKRVSALPSQDLSFKVGNKLSSDWACVQKVRSGDRRVMKC